MKILVCSDGTEQADRALTLAGLIATTCAETDTTILGIAENPSDQSAIMSWLRKAQESFPKKGVELITKDGEPVPEIVKRCKETQYDLVIIGKQRHDAMSSAKAYEIVEVVEPPVLVVPEARPDLKKILLCSGGGPYIERAINFTCRLCRFFEGSTVTLLNIMPEPPGIHATLGKREIDVKTLLNSESALAKNLRRELEMIEKAGVKGALRLRLGAVLQEIMKEIEEGDYDLIVAGSWPVNDSWRRYMMGNITRSIVNEVSRPILIVRSGIAPISLLQRLVSWLGFISKKHPTQQTNPAPAKLALPDTTVQERQFRNP
jgi:nucleotide-binding universal stress UspA family protein